MQATAQPPVSATDVFPQRSTRGAMAAAAMLLLSAVLSACTPLPESTDTAATTDLLTYGRGIGLQGAEEDTSNDPTRGDRKHLYELQPHQQGIASWYGPGFHGRKTASGERFNQYELTAAHPTYAFGTQLCVRNKSTGQTVVVRVNDRGPYAKNRVIDLSKAAAEELGMLSKGVKAVEIFKLDKGQEECPDAVQQAKG